MPIPAGSSSAIALSLIGVEAPSLNDLHANSRKVSTWFAPPHVQCLALPFMPTLFSQIVAAALDGLSDASKPLPARISIALDLELGDRECGHRSAICARPLAEWGGAIVLGRCD